MIPTYTFDNARLRDRPEKTVLWYESMGSVYVRRKNGRIISARFKAPLPRYYTPCRATGTEGVRFTRLEQIGQRRLVVHKRLPYAALSDHLTPAQREALMRAAYSAVQLSAMGLAK